MSSIKTVDKRMLYLPAPAHVGIGQQWQLCFDSDAVVRSTLVVYWGPLIGLFGTAMILEHYGFSEPWVLVGSLWAAWASWVLIRRRLLSRMCSVQLQWRELG